MKNSIFRIIILLILHVGNINANDKKNHPFSKITQVRLAKAVKFALWQKKQWHFFLHYEKTIFGNFKSRADSNGFFVSKNGLTNPKDELLDFIKSFENSVKLEKDNTICKFPARYNWVIQSIGESVTKNTFSNCPEYLKFKQKFNAINISIVFASADLDESATLFGHTLLKLEMDKTDRKQDVAVSFVGDISVLNPLTYVYDGLTGGFKGKLEFLPYYNKQVTYNINENRNLWELQLNLSLKDISKITDHIWEFRSTHFDYFFLNENCAYYNMYLLQIALHGQESKVNVPFLVTPMDTIKTILKKKGVLKKAYYFPANGNQLSANYLKLTDKEKEYVSYLTSSSNSNLKNIPGVRQDLAFSTAYFYALAHKNRRGVFKDNWKKIFDNLLKLNSANNIKIRSLAKPDYTNPSIGHGTSSATVGAGYIPTKGVFSSIEFKPTFHNLLDSPLGYLPNSEIVVLGGQLYILNKSPFVLLQKIDIVNIKSYNPINSNLYPTSWKLDIGIRNFSHELSNIPSDSLSSHLNIGFGYSLKLNFLSENSILYALGGGRVEGSGQLKSNARFAPPLLFGMLLNLTDITSYNSTLEYRKFILGDNNTYLINNNAFNILINESLAFEISYLRYLILNYSKFKISTKYYF